MPGTYDLLSLFVFFSRFVYYRYAEKLRFFCSTAARVCIAQRSGVFFGRASRLAMLRFREPSARLRCACSAACLYLLAGVLLGLLAGWDYP